MEKELTAVLVKSKKVWWQLVYDGVQNLSKANKEILCTSREGTRVPSGIGNSSGAEYWV